MDQSTNRLRGDGESAAEAVSTTRLRSSIDHLAVRIIQADWQYSQVVYGPLVLPEAV